MKIFKTFFIDKNKVHVFSRYTYTLFLKYRFSLKTKLLNLRYMDANINEKRSAPDRQKAL